MKITVLGTGSVGGWLAVRLIRAGHDVSVVDQADHLEAIRRNGIRLVRPDGEEEVAQPAAALGSAESLDAQDLVILAVKAHQIRSVADQVPALLHTRTIVLTVQNGIPWWYFHGLGGEHDGRPIPRLDPDGSLSRAIPSDRVVAGIVYPALAVEVPGVIRWVEGDRMSFGAPDPVLHPRLQEMAGAFAGTGLRTRVVEDVRSEIWLKAWGNLSLNPISALTRATLADICEFPPTRALAVAMMREAQAVAEALGATFRVDIAQRLAGAASVGHHKTSMLQDVEAGRPLELDALVGVVMDLAELVPVPVDTIRAMYACASLLDRASSLREPVLEVV